SVTPTGCEGGIAWSPAGDKLAAACDISGEGKIYFLDVSTGLAHEVLDAEGRSIDADEVVWSSARLGFPTVPEVAGTSFLVWDNHDSTFTINALGTDGGLSPVLTTLPDTRDAWWLSLAPDSRRVAYASNGVVVIRDLQTGGVVRIHQPDAGCGV